MTVSPERTNSSAKAQQPKRKRAYRHQKSERYVDVTQHTTQHAMHRTVRGRVRRLKRRIYDVAVVAAIGVAPLISAFAGSLSIPVLRDNATGTVARITAPVTNQTAKVIGPASSAVPTIGVTNAPINDSAMFRANSALKDQITSDSAGVVVGQ